MTEPAHTHRLGEELPSQADEAAETAHLRPNNEDEQPLLTVSGAELTEEELAAVSAVVGKLAAAGPLQDNDAGSTGPRDRRLQRRRSLSFNRLGLWGRPGPDSWKSAGGLR